jgi:hypothetical protein
VKYFSVLCVFLSTLVCAEETSSEKGLYGEFAVAHRFGKARADGYSSATLYLEAPLQGDISLWGMGYHDPDFKEVYAGVAQKIGNLQIALGLGTGWYDDTRRTVVAPWVFYANDAYEGLLAAEYYHGDREEPWFYKGYLQKRFGDVLVGIYGEQAFGIGPMATWEMSKNVKVWATVPLAYTSEETPMRGMLGLKCTFE